MICESEIAWRTQRSPSPVFTNATPRRDELDVCPYLTVQVSNFLPKGSHMTLAGDKKSVYICSRSTYSNQIAKVHYLVVEGMHQYGLQYVQLFFRSGGVYACQRNSVNNVQQHRTAPRRVIVARGRNVVHNFPNGRVPRQLIRA